MVIPVVFSHDGAQQMDDMIKDNSTLYITIASIIIVLFVLYSIYASKRPHFTEKKRLMLFLGIVIPIVLATTYIVGATIYLNISSNTKGPVHWHADFEIWGCGDRIDLIKPHGLSNRAGTPVFHAHGDDRIHVEGVVVDPQDINLKHFFEVIGGELNKDSIAIPTDTGRVVFRNGDSCDDSTGVLQVFVYRTENGKVVQHKLGDFEQYVLSPSMNIPPGDCIIIDFDKDKPKTNHMCETYRSAIKKGGMSYGG